MGRVPLLSRRPLQQLVREISRNDVVPPVRLMEEVLRRDPREAVPALAGRLQVCGIGTPWAPLWLTVLLGEFRDPEAAKALILELRRCEDPDPWTAQAAAEALAKLDDGATAALARFAFPGSMACRLYAYAALGWIGSPRARSVLLQAFAHDIELADVLACALGDAGAPEAIESLHAALSRCHPFQRIEIEAQIQRLHRREGRASPTGEDWRRRYRPHDRKVFRGGWPFRLRCLREHPGWPWLRTQGPPVRPLDEILADAPLREPREPECFVCTLPAIAWTGVDACGLHAEELAEEQIELIEVAEAELGGEPDLFAVLAFADTRLSLTELIPAWRLIPGRAEPVFEPGAAWSPKHEIDPWVERIYRSEQGRFDPFQEAEERWIESYADRSFRRSVDDETEDEAETVAGILQVVRSTCHWLIEQGCEELRVGKARLRQEASRCRGLDAGSHPAWRLLPPGEGASPDDVLGARIEIPVALPGTAVEPVSEIGHEMPGEPEDPDPIHQVYESRIQRQMDRYYRRWLDTPLATLDGRTPRTANRSDRSVLLHYVEGFEAAEEQRMRDGGVAYDFGWLRRELELDTTAVWDL